MRTAPIAPMIVAGVRHFVERAYRESGQFQYLRELLVNGLEASATRIEIGPEWNAVEREGVYRLMHADDGKGMNPDEMLKYLNTFGGGGKPIGDAHENYGVGSKTSILPWNHAGMVVLSWTPENPQGALVWLMRDPETGDYGAKKFQTEDGYEEVVTPFGEWALVKPDWITDHGTVVICLGNTGKEDTFLGKDGAGDIKGIAAYLNKRLWEVSANVEIFIQEMRSNEKQKWPQSYVEAAGNGPTRWNRRRLRGAKHYIDTVHTTPAKQGTVILSDGTAIDWYLGEGKRRAVHSYAHMNGYIAALYKNELYDTQTHVSQFRSFGVTQREVRENLTLIARPPMTDGSYGVYPDTARNALKIQGTKRAGEALPWAEWAQEFAENMPEAIQEALAKAGPSSSGTIKDAAWRQRLCDRFGARWKSVRYQPDSKGTVQITPDLPPGIGGAIKQDGPGTVDGDREGRRPGPIGTGTGAPQYAERPSKAGKVAGAPIHTKGGIPDYEWVTLADIDDSLVYAAAWCPPSKERPNGLVQIARDFQVIIEIKAYWRNRYAPHLGCQVDHAVEEVYGETLVARVAHSEQLVSDPRWGRTRVDNELRSPPALTASLLGLVSEDHLIAARLTGLGRRKAAA